MKSSQRLRVNSAGDIKKPTMFEYQMGFPVIHNATPYNNVYRTNMNNPLPNERDNFHAQQIRNMQIANLPFYYPQDLSQNKRQNSVENYQPRGSPKKKSCFYKQDEEFPTFDDLISGMNPQVDLPRFIKTQKGSRTLQQILNKMQPEKVDELLYIIRNHFADLMTDSYGNYFCQKLIQCCSSDQRIFILEGILPQFEVISCNIFGTHVVQSLIDIANMPEEIKLINCSVKGRVVALSTESHGTHVMQKLLINIKEIDRVEVNAEVLQNFYNLIYDPNGICVLKKYINGCKNSTNRTELMKWILSNVLEVIQNPFGNYVVQHLIDEWGNEASKEIARVIANNIFSLSMQKFASNVVEKSIMSISDKEIKDKMLTELFTSNKLTSLFKNTYGCYVIKRAISIMNEEEKCRIKAEITKSMNLASLKEKGRLSQIMELL